MSINLSWWSNIPPILDDPKDALKQYIINPQVPIHDLPLFVLPRIPNEERLYYAPPSNASTTLIAKRNFQTGNIIDYIEIAVEDAESTASNSMSLKRAPGPPSTATKGSATNYPFWPGGLNEPEKEIASLIQDNSDFEQNLLTVAPGFTEGVDFANKSEDGQSNLLDIGVSTENSTVDLLSFVEHEHSMFGLWKDNKEHNVVADKTCLANIDLTAAVNIDEELPPTSNERPVLMITNADSAQIQKMQWAEMVDVTQPVKDFNVRIPNPAHVYPFDLDIFQKQAILKLEEHNHVFVAAHTSAGKTVVAEYAIALSQKHMTRTIYTSPIKALSNQKYRDFKNEFQDVGLITGDIQIDPTASCLIMTTEILRSMLYCGSEVTRDLEYVIFDEVHYITDADRGHVWEEVLILLPDHVSIVMLSATVPNTLEFANWVGQTKQRKVFVCSTLKRPVPLTHYLYTGCGGKSKNDIFLLVDEKEEFLLKGYRDAIAAKEKVDDKGQKTKNFKQHHGINKKQEQILWVGLIDHLKRNNKLPVVAFTLSRNRCDRNVQALQSVDLCTAKEASHIHYMFQKCINKLKPEDRELPQVLILQDSLKRGIGVHHSGILPILKEIVEMLFQSGHVKWLFATETFAMGVNMPARTVIFDSIKKFDGFQTRCLRPAEYTQMAGRAGRRGLDKTGTVILVCKSDVPMEQDLRNMILGKPLRLQSQFRLTYAMILNLLRVESLTVEHMMSRSFMEYGSQIKVPENQAKLKLAEEQMVGLQELGEHTKPLCQFFDVTNEYIELSNDLMNDARTQHRIFKELKPGKVIVISIDRHYNKLGIVLAASLQSQSKEPIFKVLVLDDERPLVTVVVDDNKKESKQLERGDLWHRMISLIPKNKSYLPEGIGGHNLLTVKCQNIVEITKTSIKIEQDKLLRNWDERQIPRFRNNPPGPTFVKAVTDLANLNASIISNASSVGAINCIQDGKLNPIAERLAKLRKTLNKIEKCTNVSNFEQEFAIIYDRKMLEKRRNELRFKISKESLTLYPDYENKLQVLKTLSYIDEQHEVTMKGRVACEMGSNELIITELVLCNTFTDLEPEEIAALLSSLVFQAKTTVPTKLPDNLKRCIAAIEAVDKQIINVEQEFKVLNTDETLAKDRLNFGLVEVVYEWARNKTFAETMKLTEDVQEGIIVRCIQQLNETIHDVKDAARIIGNPALHKKMEDASNAIQRGIVFTASLYLQN